MKVAIITANTDIYKGVKENESGEAAKLVVEEAGLEVVFLRALPLDREVLSTVMKRMVDVLEDTAKTNGVKRQLI